MRQRIALDHYLPNYFLGTENSGKTHAELMELEEKIINVFNLFPYETMYICELWYPREPGRAMYNAIHLGGLTYIMGGWFYLVDKKNKRINSLDHLSENRYSKMLISNIDKIVYKHDFLGYGIGADIVFEYYERFGV